MLACTAFLAHDFMSLIHTAELTRVDPFDYLVQLQRHSAAVTNTPAQWMPWNYRAANLSDVGHRPATVTGVQEEVEHGMALRVKAASRGLTRAR